MSATKKGSSGTTATPPATSATGSSQTTVDPAATAAGEGDFAADLRAQLEESLAPAKPKAKAEEQAPEEEGAALESEDDLMPPATLEDEDEDGEEDEEEVETETETESEVEDERETEEAEDDGDEAAEVTAPRDWPRSAHKRLAKQTARIKALEAEVATLKAPATDTDKTAAGPAAPPSSQEAQLESVIATKRKVIAWARSNKDGATIDDGKGGETTFTPEQVEAIELGALEDLTEARVQLTNYRNSLAQQTVQFSAEADRIYPFFKDKTSQEFADAQEAVRLVPGLTKVPDWKLAVGDMLRGRKLRLAEAAKKTAPAAAKTPVRRPAVQPGRPAAAPPKVNAGKVNSSNRFHKFMETGSSVDGKALIEDLLTT